MIPRFIEMDEVRKAEEVEKRSSSIVFYDRSD